MSQTQTKGACLVIGAGDGVGGAIARAFALDGYETVITRRARNLDQLEALADGIRAEAVSTASGSWLWSFSGKPQGSSSALCPVEIQVYFGIAGAKALYSVRV